MSSIDKLIVLLNEAVSLIDGKFPESAIHVNRMLDSIVIGHKFTKEIEKISKKIEKGEITEEQAKEAEENLGFMTKSRVYPDYEAFDDYTLGFPGINFNYTLDRATEIHDEMNEILNELDDKPKEEFISILEKYKTGKPHTLAMSAIETILNNNKSLTGFPQDCIDKVHFAKSIKDDDWTNVSGHMIFDPVCTEIAETMSKDYDIVEVFKRIITDPNINNDKISALKKD